MDNTITPKHIRNSNLELFRIIVMCLIVAHHFVVNSGLVPVITADFPSSKSIFLIFFGWAGKTGINCFVLITGYFMCTSKITLRKGLKLLLQVEFYKIIFFFFFVQMSYIELTHKTLLKRIMLITSISDGFVSCYLIFFGFFSYYPYFAFGGGENIAFCEEGGHPFSSSSRIQISLWRSPPLYRHFSFLRT